MTDNREEPAVSLRSIAVELPHRRLLNEVSLRLLPRESVAIMGPSGSGKTTLLNCVAGIQIPTAGDIIVAGRRISEMTDSARSRLRLRNIGMIFQFGELLPELTVRENVELPLRLLGVSRAEAGERGTDLLTTLGLDRLAESFTDGLSGGEIQRVGIARALVTSPKVLLADEPTGALDEDNAMVVMKLLLDCVDRFGVGLILATHDLSISRQCGRVYRLVRGGLQEDLANRE